MNGALQGAFQFPHVAADVLGDEIGHIVGQADARLLGLALQDGHPHLQLRRLDGHDQARVQTRDQPVVDALEFLRVGVAGDDDLPLVDRHRLEHMEELFLRALLVRQELDVVDQQHVQRLVIVLEAVDGVAPDGLDQVLHELVRRDVADDCSRFTLLDGVAHRLHQVGLAQAHAAVNEERVVGTAGAVGHLQGGGPGQVVGLAVHEGRKGQPRIQARALVGHLPTQPAEAAGRRVGVAVVTRTFGVGPVIQIVARAVIQHVRRFRGVPCLEARVAHVFGTAIAPALGSAVTGAMTRSLVGLLRDM